MLITKYGLPQAAVCPLVILALMGALGALGFGSPWLPFAELLLALVLGWALSFFRDPPRRIPETALCLVSPADGRVTDAAFTAESPLGGTALKIGVFLSIFNVHINRAPCPARVEAVEYRKGAKLDARSPEAGRVNESNNVFMTGLETPRFRLLVRQISGAIARRIVCDAAPGKVFRRGEPFGMIKFGSRTELYVACENPADLERFEIAVKPGDKVKAGVSMLVRYKDAES